MYYNITVKIVQDVSNQKKAHCVFNINPNNVPIPWRCTVHRLESYGDADLKDWARRIEAYYLNYSQVIKSYFDMINVENLDEGRVQIGLRKARKRAMNAVREVEEKSVYFRTVHFSNEEGTELLSGDLHEEFLKELDFSLEDFATLTERNGILTVFDYESEIYLEYTKKFFECITLNGSPMQIHPEYTTIIFRKDGTKKEVVMQNIVILEPTLTGIFTYTYYMIVGKGKGLAGQKAILGCEGEEPLGEKSLLEEIREDIEKEKDEMIEKEEEKDQ